MIIIDSNYICQRARYTVGELDSDEAGIIFGFLKDILKIGHHFKSNNIIFTWDSIRSKRRDIFSGYKSKRREKTEEEKHDDKIAYLQFGIIRTYVLKYIGFRNNFVKTGYEADDIIAKLVMNWASTKKKLIDKDKPIVVSTDNDLYQLLGFCHLFNPQKKTLYTENDFEIEFGIKPIMWRDVKAIAGCSTDSVPGVKGIGYKTAVKFLTGDLSVDSKAVQKIAKEFEKVYERNKKLVYLPFDDNLDFVIRNNEFNFDNFIDLCDEYNFRSFTRSEYLNKWKEFFNGF